MLLDGFFDIINKIWKYKFFDNEYVDKIFSASIIVACAWLIIKVLLELILNHIVKSDTRESPLSIYRGIVLAIFMMFLITPLFQFGHKASTELTKSVIQISGISSEEGTESGISKMLVQSMSNDDEMKKDDKKHLINNWRSVDINDTDRSGLKKYYKYSVNFFVLSLLSILVVFLLFFVAIQMSKRVLEIALYRILAPFCCISLISNHSKSFSVWVKCTMGAFLVTSVQFVSIGLMINMIGNAISKNGNLVGIFLIIGALLFIINTPQIVNSLLGQQSGLMSAFGDIQSMLAIGTGLKAGMSLTSGALVKGASVIPKGAGYLSGVKNQFSNYKSNGSSFMGAMGKTMASEMARPFVSGFQRASSSMKNNFNEGKSRSSYSSFNFNNKGGKKE